jgi:Secretion system C-terminal sorting domain
MKKNQLLFTASLLIGLFIIFSSNSNPSSFTKDVTGNSGLPSGGISCGNSYCHGGIAGADATRLNIQVLDANGNAMSTYVPGSVYTVRIKAHTYNSTRAGFQCVASNFFGTTGAGTVVNNIMPANINVATYAAPALSTAEYVTHTVAGTTAVNVFANGYTTWEYNWTAPATNIGAINFACAVNITNNSSTPQGDSAFNGVLTLQAPTGTTSLKNIITTLQCYPNPCTTNITIASTQNFEINTKIAIVNTAGIIVKSFVVPNISNSINVDVANIPVGLYSVILGNATQQATYYIVKK